ncbi:MAG: hypothetical protein A6F70_08285 [Cycloclasticus sp. symbiont of Bathymodiolus heckerae]|nr:MAG: hypothetical protein A6F70_08285 [Cycloclasticus sp. symbiont of Bathymodiolus heckerae]
MPYINRNKQGDIEKLLDVPAGENCQWLEANDPDVLAFVQKVTQSDHLKGSLASSDSEMVRVVEDLVDMLMEKQVFVFTELPEAVQSKLNERRKLRHQVNEISNLIGEDDNIL